MTQTQTDNKKTDYIVVFNPHTAALLEENGYTYILQKFNKNQQGFAFEATDELVRFIEEDSRVKNFGEIVYAKSNNLNF